MNQTSLSIVYLLSAQCPAAARSFVLNLRIISNLVIRVCYQDNGNAPALSVPKPGRTATVRAGENIPVDENKTNIRTEFITGSLLL